MSSLTAAQRSHVDALVKHYASAAVNDVPARFTRTLHDLFSTHSSLKPHIHSVRSRIKDPEHLRDKLFRAMSKSVDAGIAFEITKDNLHKKINDLSGVRILHLHTRQMQAIDTALKQILAAESLRILEGPRARTWDDETRSYFQSIGIETEPNDRMYTSVHYIVAANNIFQNTAEIQVRTLAEELWGEVDHSLNYPHPTTVSACGEQIKVLARLTSTCSRLVDSIYRTQQEHQTATERQRKRTKKQKVAKRSRRS
jgi:putative GTP pyrophosphokinase